MIPIGMAGQHKLKRVEPTPITTEDIPAFVAAVDGAFHEDPTPADFERIAKKLEPERTLAIRDRGKIVAGASIYSRHVSVPGGDAPVAGVTQVGVLPTHRRRGMLTALMHRQLADIREAGNEAIAMLWAAEGAIYGRYGYGLASLLAELNVDTSETLLRAPTTVRPELCQPADAVDAMRPIHAAVRRTRPGMVDREGPWWDVRIADPESERDGASALRAAVIEDAAYALYSVKTKVDHNRMTGAVLVREAMAATTEGYAAIWQFLLNLDLTRTLSYPMAPSDEPLMHLVTEAQAAPLRLSESLWVRLVDVPKALMQRGYGQPFEVVLDVADDVCPWNAGRWALRWDGETAACGRTALPAALELSVVELGAVYLGGTTLVELARAGRVRELRAGALIAASRAFRGDLAPWCPEIF
jgi:predicted acetyltransferase